MKKILSIALVALVGLFLGACSDSKNKESNASVELKVGTAPNYKPFNLKKTQNLQVLILIWLKRLPKKMVLKLFGLKPISMD